MYREVRGSEGERGQKLMDSDGNRRGWVDKTARDSKKRKRGSDTRTEGNSLMLTFNRKTNAFI